MPNLVTYNISLMFIRGLKVRVSNKKRQKGSPVDWTKTTTTIDAGRHETADEDGVMAYRKSVRWLI